MFSMAQELAQDNVMSGTNLKKLNDGIRQFEYAQSKVCKNLNCANDDISLLAQLYEIGIKQANNKLLEKVAEKFSKFTYKDHHRKIVEYIRGINAPILTTNYDDLLSKSIGATLYEMTNSATSYRNPWNYYYANSEISNPLKSFAIWHINGFIEKAQSIKLGLGQYTNMISEASNIMHVHNGAGAYNFLKTNESNFMNSFLNVFLNKSLFIVGLALDEDEIFLRWLLLQRAMYLNGNPYKNHKAWYVLPTDEFNKMESGKKFFLENVGVQLIPVDKSLSDDIYTPLYEDIWS
jgi:hypothetical protein